MSHKTLSFVLFLICFANTCILFTNYSHRKAIDKIDDRLEDLENYITKSRPVEDALQNEVFDLRDAVNTIIAEMKE